VISTTKLIFEDKENESAYVFKLKGRYDRFGTVGPELQFPQIVLCNTFYLPKMGLYACRLQRKVEKFQTEPRTINGGAGTHRGQ
jgi:hypothetical protein